LIGGFSKTQKEDVDEAKKVKERRGEGRYLNVCISPNNEKVVFNQKTGKITYE